MNERDQLNQAKEQLKQSISNVFQDLRTYGNAVAKNTGAIYAEKKDDLVSRMEFARLEREMERDIKARTREHKSGMKEALRENDRLQRQERRLRFKEGVKQKTSSVFGKLGQVKNDMLAKLNPSNIDVKLRDFYEKAQIKGLEIANKGKEVYNNTAQKIDNFTTQQIANYYERKEARIEAKEFKEAARRAEKEEIERIKERVRERKAAMKEALRTQEREMYENKHLENQARKQELMDSLFGSSEIQEERVSYAR